MAQLYTTTQAPPRCTAHDDDAKLVALAGHTCAQAQALALCKILHFSALDKLCPCALVAGLV